MAHVLVDSSVWIAASRKDSPQAKSLGRLLRADEVEVYTTELIRVEVTQGARTTEEFERLWLGLNALQPLSFSENSYQKSAWNYFRLRKQGISIATIDCLIGTLAAEHKVSLWSLDKVFKRISPLLGFELFGS